MKKITRILILIAALVNAIGYTLCSFLITNHCPASTGSPFADKIVLPVTACAYGALVALGIVQIFERDGR